MEVTTKPTLEKAARSASEISQDKPLQTTSVEGLELAHEDEGVLSSYPSSSPSLLSNWILFATCMLMHAVLVAIPLTLVILRYKLHGDSIQVSDDKLNEVTGVLFYYVTVFPNIVIKVYEVPLLYITQKLALKRYLHQEQTLTSMHDKSKAWLSLGATGATVWKYKNLLKWKEHPEIRKKDLVSFGGVVCILLYLGGSLLMGIIAPDLITLGDVVGNATDFQRLTSYISNIGQDRNQIGEAFPIVDIVPLLWDDGDVITTGLLNNLIYDVPNFATNSVVTVNGTAFAVECHSISGASQSGDFDPATGTFPIHISDQINDVHISPSSQRVLNIRSTTWSGSSGDAPPPTLIIVSTLPVVDSNDMTGSTLSLNPQVNPVNCASSSECGVVSTVGIAACNVELQRLHNGVQVYTNAFPIQIYSNTSLFDFGDNGIEQLWEDWTVPGVPTDPGLFSIGDLGSISPPSHLTQFFTVPNSGGTINNTLSIFEDNMMEALGYYQAHTKQIYLGDMELVLAMSISSIFWRAAVKVFNNQTVPGDEFTRAVKYSLQISKWTPWVGLAISFVMWVIALIVTRPPTIMQHSAIEGLGPLELTWLLGKDPTIASELASGVEYPTGDHLRSLGKDVVVAFHRVGTREQAAERESLV